MSTVDKEIEDYTYTYTKIVKKIRIRCIEFSLFSYARFVVDMFTADDNHIKTDVVTIEGDEYTGWGNDDNYIYTLIGQKLGVSFINSNQ